MIKLSADLITKDWSLFLDRDGVINVRPLNDYVKNLNDFIFISGVMEAFGILSGVFGKTFIVTNQQGVGLGYMNQATLEEIHQFLFDQVTQSGGRIDSIYCCTDVRAKENNCRKPSITMALQAKADFPAIDFSKSIMVGDTASDIEFGRNAGMFCVLIGDEKTTSEPDLRFGSLLDFAEYLKT
jgi:histidinol-phosphate phosphatase family protein